MKTISTISLVTWLILSSQAATLFVAKDNSSASYPYDAWTNAAADIQTAINASSIGDTILVSNGVYDTGSTNVAGQLTNRIAITKSIVVASVNGPSTTFIVGQKDPVSTNGDYAIRCVYLADGASLVGFTITNGATQLDPAVGQVKYGGGVFCETTNAVVSNCFITGNDAGLFGGGVYNGTIINSIISDNRCAWYGGGVEGAILYNCTLSNNFAHYSGGGADGSTLFSCRILNNSVDGAIGGGVAFCTLDRCLLEHNHGIYQGGGAAYSTALNTIIRSNACDQFGGGAAYGNLRGCVVYANSAHDGGGVFEADLVNCTLIDNSASLGGGVAAEYVQHTVLNSIVYDNYAAQGSNTYGDFLTFTNSCTAPDPQGTNNLTDDPQLADLLTHDFHLTAASPCIDAGIHDAWMDSATDIDMQPRLFGPSVDIGADEAVIQASLITCSTNLLIEWQTVSGATCTLERSASLLPQAWTSVSASITATGLLMTTELTNSSDINIYRLKWTK